MSVSLNVLQAERQKRGKDGRFKKGFKQKKRRIYYKR